MRNRNTIPLTHPRNALMSASQNVESSNTNNLATQDHNQLIKKPRDLVKTAIKQNKIKLMQQLQKIAVKIIPYFQISWEEPQDSLFALIQKQMGDKTQLLLQIAEQLGPLAFINYAQTLLITNEPRNFLMRFLKLVILTPTILQVCKKTQIVEAFVEIVQRIYYFPYQGQNSFKIIELILQLTDFFVRNKMDQGETRKFYKLYRGLMSHLPVYYQLAQMSQKVSSIPNQQRSQMSQLQLELNSIYDNLSPFKQIKSKIRIIYQKLHSLIKFYPSRHEATSLAFFCNIMQPKSPQVLNTSSYILDNCKQKNYPEIFMLLKSARSYIKHNQIMKSFCYLFHQTKIMLAKEKCKHILSLKQLIENELANMLDFLNFNEFDYHLEPSQVIYEIDLPTKNPIDWPNFLKGLKGSINFSDCRITSICQMLILENQVKSGERILDQMQTVQLQKPGQFLMGLFKGFPCLKLFDKDFLQIMGQILKIAEVEVTNSILIHYVKWILLQIQKQRGNQKKQIEQYFYAQFCLKIISIQTEQPKLQSLQNVFLHTNNFLQKIAQNQFEKKRNQKFEKLISQQSSFFKVLKRLTVHYERISDLFKKYGSLKHSAYFLELQYFQSKMENQTSQTSQTSQNARLKQKARSIYCELVPELKSIDIINPNKLNAKKVVKQQLKFNNQSSSLIQNLGLKLFGIVAEDRFDQPCSFIGLYQQVFKLENLEFTSEVQIIRNSYLKLQGIKNLFYNYRRDCARPNVRDKGEQVIRESCQKFKNYHQKIQFLLLTAQLLPQLANIAKAIYYECLLNNRDIERLQSELNVFDKFESKNLEQLQYLLQISVEKLYSQFGLKIIKIIKRWLETLKTSQYSNPRVQTLWAKTAYLQMKINKQTQLSFSMKVEQYIRRIYKRVQQLTNKKIEIKSIFIQYCIKALKCACEVNYWISLQLCQALFRAVYSLIDAVIKSAQQAIPNKFEIKTKLYIFTMKLILQKTENQHIEQNEELKEKFNNLLGLYFPAEIAKELTGYLIQSLPNINYKRYIIVNQLIKIAKKYKYWSSWWLSSLCCHNFDLNQKKKEIKLIDIEIEQIGKFIFQQSQIQTSCFKFIEQIRSYLTQKKLEEFANKQNKIVKLKVPNGMTDPFKCDMVLKSFSIDMAGIGSGKSRPIRAKAQYEKHQKKNFILKRNPQIAHFYRIQGQSSSFFRQLKILDEQTTFGIINLSRRCMMIQQLQGFEQVTEIIKKRQRGAYLDSKSTDRNNEQAFCFLFDKLYPNARSDFYRQVFQANSINEWWEKFNNYARTTAQWSYIGYISGLGDRHFGNILMNSKCKIAHIDFQFNLDIGKTLRFPQWVPFRFTKAVKEPFGLLQQQGLFLSYFVQAANKLRENQSNFEQAVSNFYQGPDSFDIITKMKARAFFTNRKETITQSCQILIAVAGSENILRDMYKGWKPWL